MIADKGRVLSLLMQSPQATAIFDSCELHIAYVNQAMLAIWRADESIVGKTLCACFPNFEEEGFCAILRDVWNTGITYCATETAANIIAGGQQVKRYFDFEYKAMVDEHGKCYAILHTASDVTDRKLAYYRVEKQREQLSLHNRLNILANTLSHDLKNPLSVLKLGNDFLSKNEQLPVKVTQQWYKNFADSIKNIELIINQTLHLNKVRNTENITEYMAMDQKIGEWIQEVQNNFPDQQMEFRLGHLYALNADRAAVYQIFIILIGNAVKYAIKTEQAYLNIYSEMTDKGIIYILEDNGVGIPESELNKIFHFEDNSLDPTVKPNKGIGLSLVKDLMEFVGGKIDFTSQLGKGTVLRLLFPHHIDS